MNNWLDKYEQGGMVLKQKTKDNYGKKANPNNPDVSLPPEFKGLAYNTKGRNYSPAWGGQFENGGYVAQKGKSIPTTADSVRLFNSQMALNKFYDNEMKAGKIRKFPRSSYSSADVSYNFSPSSLKRLNEENLQFYREKIKERNTFRGRGIYDENYAEYFNLSPEKVRELENKGLAQTKGNSEYQQYYRDLITPMQNLASPFALVDSRIRPQGQISYGPIIDGTNKNVYPGGSVSVFDYDPLAIKPYHMRTDKEKIEWEKKYGKKTTTEKSKTEPEKKKTPVTKKSEETKPAPYTPKGSKKYIVNGIEVSEEDFLGTGSTTGGSKRIIYSTPKLKDRKVLRLDGTPETDPEKIRKAMRAQEKDDEFQDGGNLMPAMAGANQTMPMYQMGGSIPGAVGFTYARTVGAAPSNGPYAKKTKASAQNGMEMKYYQEGLDFKPKTISKNGGWLDKFDTAQDGKFMSNLISKEENKNRGDIASYFPQIQRMKDEPKIKEVIVKADQKRQKQILAEAVAIGNKNRTTVKQDNRTSREKEIAQQQVVNAYLNEAKGKSPFAQTLSSFTPTGYNPEASKIAAENIGQMTPMMGATRLFNTVRDPENNPYGIGQGNGFLANTLGTIGLLGDVFDVGAVTAPGVKAAGNYLTQQTPLRNAHKLNPYALTDDILFNKEGVVNRQIFGDEAFESFKQYGPTTRPGVPEIDKFMEFIKAPRSQIRSANDEVFEVVNTMEDGAFKYPYFQEGSLWYTGQQRNNLAKELGKERIITTPKSDIWFAPAGEATLMGGDDLVSKGLIDKYSKGRRVLIPGTEYAKPSKYSVFEPHWWKGYKQIQKDGGDIPVDPDGYWNPENWGNPVIIPSTDITMGGVDQPLIGISDTGDTQYMEPGEDYEFDGEYVTEYPVAKKGISVNNADAQPIKKLDQSLNFTNYNKPTKGGWLDKYN
jgi:hypothetical protein